MASAVLFERQPFERIVLCRTVAKVLSRKQVTVLFADLKGSMELLADVTPKRRASSSIRAPTDDGSALQHRPWVKHSSRASGSGHHPGRAAIAPRAGHR
jgi:hypothetical protein